MELQEIAKHLAVLNDDFTKISISLAVLEERLDWIYKIIWLIITTSVGAFLTNLWQLWKMHRNDKK